MVVFEILDMPRVLTFPLLLILVLLFIGGGAILWWNVSSQPPGAISNLTPFVISPGTSATTVGKNLEKEGFIRSSLAFKVFMQFSGNAGKIKAGDYRLAKNLSLPELVRELVRGPIAVWVTIPEGFRREEIGQKLVLTLELSPDKKENFLKDFAALTQGREGFLFPDTYLFFKNASASAVVGRLTDNFNEKVDEEIVTQAKIQGLTKEELITLASVVERETLTDQERPIVAGILLKRLDIGMALQADATLQFAISNFKCQISNFQCEWWPTVISENKTIKSPYNTYTNLGLPPGPIANPGLASIKAVANPEDSPYLYYLHDKEGKIHYAQTLEEHGENIKRYLQ